MESKIISYKLDIENTSSGNSVKQKRGNYNEDNNFNDNPVNDTDNSFRRILKAINWEILWTIIITSIIVGILVPFASKTSTSSTSVSKCNNMCFFDLEEIDCPKIPPFLKACRSAELGSLCLDVENYCRPTSKPSICTKRSTDIYRAKRCPSIDEPWNHATNGFEYYIENLPMNWTSHRLRARQFNAFLASFHDQGEMDFVVQLLSKIGELKAFIGGFRSGAPNDPYVNSTELYWKWDDNTAWDFASWGEKNPNQIDPESKVFVDGSKMYFTDRSSALIGIYKRRKVSKYNGTLELGTSHSCASNFQNDLYCWGRNAYGELGLGTTNKAAQFDYTATPSKVHVGVGRFVKRIALGGLYTCAILDDASLKCWGDNRRGQLGYEATNQKNSIPTQVKLGPVAQISLGSTHACAILDNGSLNCWGFNSNGELGIGNFDEVNNIIEVNVGKGRYVTQVALGDSHTCAVLDDASLMCWGGNDKGQLGDGSFEQKSVPTKINIGDGRNVSHVSLGSSHTCVILDNGSMKCWGLNDHCQLGHEKSESIIGNNQTIPIEINIGEGRSVTQVSLGSNHTCALLNGGSLKCWGNNDVGQLGDGSTISKCTPTEVDFGEDIYVTKVELGREHTCSALSNGSLKCWGKNIWGALGNGKIRNYSKYPSPVTF